MVTLQDLIQYLYGKNVTNSVLDSEMRHINQFRTDYVESILENYIYFFHEHEEIYDDRFMYVESMYVKGLVYNTFKISVTYKLTSNTYTRVFPVNNLGLRNCKIFLYRLFGWI